MDPPKRCEDVGESERMSELSVEDAPVAGGRPAPRRGATEVGTAAGALRQRALLAGFELMPATSRLPLPLRNGPPEPPEEMPVVLDGVVFVPGKSKAPELPEKGCHELS